MARNSSDRGPARRVTEAPRPPTPLRTHPWVLRGLWVALAIWVLFLAALAARVMSA